MAFTHALIIMVSVALAEQQPSQICPDTASLLQTRSASNVKVQQHSHDDADFMNDPVTEAVANATAAVANATAAAVDAVAAADALVAAVDAVEESADKIAAWKFAADASETSYYAAFASRMKAEKSQRVVDHSRQAVAAIMSHTLTDALTDAMTAATLAVANVVSAAFDVVEESGHAAGNTHTAATMYTEIHQRSEHGQMDAGFAEFLATRAADSSRDAVFKSLMVAEKSRYTVGNSTLAVAAMQVVQVAVDGLQR